MELGTWLDSKFVSSMYSPEDGSSFLIFTAFNCTLLVGASDILGLGLMLALVKLELNELNEFLVIDGDCDDGNGG